jgi:hypothetical protein
LLITHYIRANKLRNSVAKSSIGGNSAVTPPQISYRERHTWRIAAVGLVAMLSLCPLAISAVALSGNYYAPIFSTTDVMPGGAYYGGISYVSSGMNYTDQTMMYNPMVGEFWNISFPHPAEELIITTSFSSAGTGVRIVASLLPSCFSVAFRTWNSTDYAYIKIILIGSAETNMNDGIETFVVYPWQATGENLTWTFSSYDFIESGIKGDLLSPLTGQYEQQLNVVVIAFNAKGQSISALTQLEITLELGRTLEIF